MATKDDRVLSGSEYWDNRYSSSNDAQTHEWFRSFVDLEPFLQEQLFGISGLTVDNDPVVLHLGSGESVRLHLQLFHLISDVTISAYPDRIYISGIPAPAMYRLLGCCCRFNGGAAPRGRRNPVEVHGCTGHEWHHRSIY